MNIVSKPEVSVRMGERERERQWNTVKHCLFWTFDEASKIIAAQVRQSESKRGKNRNKVPSYSSTGLIAHLISYTHTMCM